MERLYQATQEALLLLVTADADLWAIISTSFHVSLQAILYITPLALVISFALAYLSFPGKRILTSVIHTSLAFPAVIVGLTLYLLFSRSGPMGDLNLLFTQTAMVVGQMVLAFPIVVAMAHSAFQASDRAAWETARTLGASPGRAMLTVMYEVRFGVFAAVIAAFSRIIAEVGCSMMIGGNILGYTRNMTTAIALETSRGEFAQGIALGIVLVLLALIMNMILTSARYRLEVV